MSPYEQWTLIWYAMSAIATAISAVIVLTAVVLTYRQVREASRARQLEATLAVLNLIDSPEYRSARRIAFMHDQEMKDLLKQNPTLEDLDTFFKSVSDGKVDFPCFHSYLASLEHVSILVLHDLAPDSIIDMYFGNIAPHHREVLSPLIQYMRGVYGSDEFLQHFEMLNKLIKKDGLRISGSSVPSLIARLRAGVFLDKSERLKQDLLSQKRALRKEAKISGTAYSVRSK